MRCLLLAAATALLLGACGQADIGEEPNAGDGTLPDRTPTPTPNPNPTPTPTPPSGTTVKLTVNLTGTGTGTIASNPAGLSCAVSTCTGSFPAGSKVTLTPQPGSGATFSAFSGGGCTGATCAPTLAADTAITAQFDSLDGTWSGTYTHSQMANGCTFNNAGNLSTVLKTAGASTTSATATGFQLKDQGCNLVAVKNGTAADSPLTVTGTTATGTWTFAIQGASGNLPLPFKGTISGKTMTGTWTCQGCSGNFTLTRQ